MAAAPRSHPAPMATPMALATTMYHTRKNPLRGLKGGGEDVDVIREGRRRRLHKAFLRYHDPANWPLLREALNAMGRSDLIGNGKKQLIPAWQPKGFEGGRGHAEPRTARDHVHAPTRQSVSPARNKGVKTAGAAPGLPQIQILHPPHRKNREGGADRWHSAENRKKHFSQ